MKPSVHLSRAFGYRELGIQFGTLDEHRFVHLGRGYETYLVLYLVLTFLILNYSSASTGLVGHWKLDGNAKDSSGNNNHGYIEGAIPELTEMETQIAPYFLTEKMTQ